jgi:anaerobic selenocysteine-containing dehydrogenase
MGLRQLHGGGDIACQGLAAAGYSRLASLTKGTWIGWLGFGDSAGPCADVATFGWVMGQTYLINIENPKLIILWGSNPAVTGFHRMRKYLESKKKGCKIIVIDPRFTASAARADEYIPIRPGTDMALALAMANVIMKQGLEDKSFIAQHTVGPLLVRNDSGLFLRESDLVRGGDPKKFIVFDSNTAQAQIYTRSDINPHLSGVYNVSGIECQPAYQLLVHVVEQYTPEVASEITGVPVSVVHHLAEEYATNKPAIIERGMGLQRAFYGDLAWRAIAMLAAITGNIKLERPSTFVMNFNKFRVPKEMYNYLPVMLLYDAVLRGEPLQIKAVLFAGHNFVNQLPNTNKIVNDFLPRLDLIVVCDLFMNMTAKYADYVLPVSSFYECTDLRVSAGRDVYLALQPKIIEPLYESKSDFQVAVELAKRLGFEGYFAKTEEEYIEEIINSNHPTMEGVTLERLRKGPIPAKPLYRAPEFRTPTGKIEFYVEKLKPLGQELPVYIESMESPQSALANKYPLVLLSTHPRHRIHSSMANVDKLRKTSPEPILEIHPDDARRRNIKDNDTVYVFNDRGKVKLKAKVSTKIIQGVVNIEQGWWPEHYSEGHHNELTHDRVNQAQRIIFEPNAAFYDVLIEVKKGDSH